MRIAALPLDRVARSGTFAVFAGPTAVIDRR